MKTLALIGVGKWGKHYIDVCKKIKNCHLKYISSPNILTHSWIPKGYIKISHYKDLSRYSDIDGIIIATPPDTHFEIASYFIKRKIDVLIEKPLTTSHKKVLSLKRMQKKYKTVVFSGHVYLHNNAFLKLTSHIDKIGILQELEFEGSNVGESKIPVLWDWSSHDVAMALYILKTEPISVSAKNIKEKKGVHLKLLFPKNISVSIRNGWISTKRERSLIATGSKGVMVFDDTKKKKLIFYKNISQSTSLESKYIPYKEQEPLVMELLNFLHLITKRKNINEEIDSAARVIKILEAADRSLANNGKLISL